MIHINLLPEEYRRKARTPIKLMAGFAAAIAINASLMAYLGWVTFAVAGAVESERSTLQLELDGLTPQVELRVREPRPGGHALDIAGLDHGRVTHAIAVGYLAAHDDGYNLHLLVRVRGEPLPRGHHVVCRMVDIRCGSGLAPKHDEQKQARGGVKRPAHRVMEPRLGRQQMRCDQRQHRRGPIRADLILDEQIARRIAFEDRPELGPVPVEIVLNHMPVVTDPGSRQPDPGRRRRERHDEDRESPKEKPMLSFHLKRSY